MHEEMRSAKMIDDALRVFKSEEYSRFQNFDDALNALTRKLYEREYYNTPNSSICILYNLEFHRFQTFASCSSFRYSDAYTRIDEENSKVQYPFTTITIVEIKTNQNEGTCQMQPLKDTSLAHEIGHTLFPDFSLTIRNWFKMSKRDSSDEARKGRAMICDEQSHRKRPL
jgi:hypothetical protein